VGWSREVATIGGRTVSVTWSRSGALNRCMDRGYAEDLARLGGRHVRVTVRRPIQPAPADPELSETPAAEIRPNHVDGEAGVAGFEPATYGFGDRRSTN
jgi:hypothetical protein